MKKFTFLVFSLLSVIFTNAQTIVNVTDATLAGDAHWTSDNIYLLDGFVFLEAGTLTIDAGTVIKGKEEPTNGDNASALIITTGAKIMAEGTADNPIIFTAEADDLNDPADLEVTDRGLWGGVILLGKGKLGFNTETAQIEGIESTEPRAQFGGQDDEDNSGVMKYVSIRHGGAELSPGDEINGLTFGGVGSNTVIEHIEVIANDDDGYEWFGGTVSCKWLISAFNKDDCFDYDFGWRGNGQFWFALQGTDKADNGGEHDGAKDDDRTPYSKPMIYNATYIGSGATAVGEDLKNSTALLFRDNAAGMYANSIFTDFANDALEVEDLAAGVDSRNQMETGELVLKNNIWYGFGAGSTWDDVIRPTETGGDISFVKTHLTANANTMENPQIAGISRDADNGLDPRPMGGSPAWENIAAYPENIFFTSVDYKGAFGTENWAKKWTALDAMEYFGEIYVSAFDIDDNGFGLGQNYPNPFKGTTTIEYTIKKSVNVNLSIFDITGKMVQPVVSENQMKGTYKVNVSGLQQGMYFYRLVAGENKATHKMIVQ
ncbi:MAG: T9SS type A sorting domain-containing protein [Draconibacterium sp.]|nr:T9SS type A sorting domain-containing protein [Draconibacterium sp.]